MAKTASMNVDDTTSTPQDDFTSYPAFAKVLHLGLVLSVTFELWNSLAALWFSDFSWFPLHVLAGLILTGWLTLTWLVYGLTPWGRHLIATWFSPSTPAAIIQDLRLLFRGRLPSHGVRPGLSSLWQATFFIGVSIVTFGGFAGWLVLRGDLHWIGGARVGLTLMRLGTPLLAYLWIGHVTMATYHALRGDSLWRIFAVWKRG
ncbi:MAG: hypothetical protein WCY67_04655 [Acidithiobacillus sp.]